MKRILLPVFASMHPGKKLLFFFFIVVASMLTGGIIAFFWRGESLVELRIRVFVNQLFTFLIPAFIAAALYAEDRREYLGLRKVSSPVLLGLTFLIMLAFTPLVNYTGFLNAKMELPDVLAGLEESMRTFEEKARILTDRLLSSRKGLSDFALNLLIVAFLPAVAEELIFRGVLLQIFREWSRSVHFAVGISAFIFSFIHFQFYGFLPRFLLGLLFGYLFVWSKSIYIPVAAHFFNNAAAVSLYFFADADTDFLQESQNFGLGNENFIFVLWSLPVFLMLLFLFKKKSS
ncbi:MAG: hypothetical protein CSB06_02395 [Bacteroidia bacterium]|nr:MAG: hypothetical protein CSB06_02395 [Bacteroidia bacterium]